MHIIFNNTKIDKNLYKTRIFKRGDCIFTALDECNEVGFIEEGKISISTHTFSYKEFEINSLGPNSSYGSFLVFSSKPMYLGTAIALKQTKVHIFTKDNLLKAFEDKQFLNNYLNILADVSLSVQKKVKILSQGTIEDKILFILFSNYQETKSLSIKIKSKESFARYLCVTRPSLSRELIRLKNKNVLDFNRNSITLNKDYLLNNM